MEEVREDADPRIPEVGDVEVRRRGGHPRGREDLGQTRVGTTVPLPSRDTCSLLTVRPWSRGRTPKDPRSTGPLLKEKSFPSFPPVSFLECDPISNSKFNSHPKDLDFGTDTFSRREGRCPSGDTVWASLSRFRPPFPPNLGPGSGRSSSW